MFLRPLWFYNSETVLFAIECVNVINNTGCLPKAISFYIRSFNR